MSSNSNSNSNTNRNVNATLGFLAAAGAAAGGLYLLSKAFGSSSDEQRERRVENRQPASRVNSAVNGRVRTFKSERADTQVYPYGACKEFSHFDTRQSSGTRGPRSFNDPFLPVNSSAHSTVNAASKRNGDSDCILCDRKLYHNNKIELKCDHVVHHQCYRSLQDMGQTTCPVTSCRKPLKVEMRYFYKPQGSGAVQANRSNHFSSQNSSAGFRGHHGHHGNKKNTHGRNKIAITSGCVEADPEMLILSPCNSEAEFWKNFFRIIEPKLKEKFVNRVASEGPYIAWDFWIQKGGSKKEQYRKVLSEATRIIQYSNINWQAHNVEILLTCAEKVKDARLNDIDKAKNNSDWESHSEVYSLWRDLYEALEELFKRLRSTPKYSIVYTDRSSTPILEMVHQSLTPSPDNDETNFWKTFFDEYNYKLLEQFERQVALEDPFISWDFWIEPGDKNEQYRKALSRTTSIIKDCHWGWEHDVLQSLSAYAKKVRDKRLKDLNKANSPKHTGHLEVFQLWDDLCDVIDESLNLQFEFQLKL